MKNSVDIIGTRGYPSYYGGFETLVRNLAPYLADHDWDVTVYGRPGAVRADDPLRDPRVASRESWGVESKSLSTLSYGLSSSIRSARRKPDVALIMNVANGYWLPSMKVRGIPTVVNVDGIEWEREKWGLAAKGVFRIGASLTARWADYLVYDSIALGQRWSEEFGRTGTFIPYGGTNPDVLPPSHSGSPGSYALLVARFVPENTVSEFFDAAEVIARSHDVVIVGSSGYGGEFDRRVKNMADGNSRIHALGHVSDDRRLFSLWQNAGAYFHGHSVGGTNPALVQAMACGAPIVARDTVFNHEVLADTAVFVEPNGHRIAEAMLSLLKDRPRQLDLGNRARLRSAERYSWDLVCGAYEDALIGAIGKS
ncbi:glycosyl transferase [Rhodococcus sp. 05-339-2]|uniref:glycosyltransferase n=1 Tax=Rhodococcoides fascians TaxID=1828 RepID=UPI0009E69828|nr:MULTISPECIES: glycosyltransferase [Rhodococcus]OZD86057.1 glycosyl transferase [Rhodococcus sp. 05-339-2]